MFVLPDGTYLNEGSRIDVIGCPRVTIGGATER